tara:strand:+ start:205 stop:504 length:300 start_codon:yes stop_codon:yes gene_type:complete
MISEGVFMLLIVLAVLSAYATFLYRVPVWVGGPFAALLFALVALYSDAVYADIGTAGKLFDYAAIQIIAAVCAVIMVVGVFIDVMTNAPANALRGRDKL